MKILAIETSCDDTGISVLKISKGGSFSILSNIVASQIDIHKKYGGVFPAMAKREHQRNLLPVFIKSLQESKLLKVSNNQFPISKLGDIKKILEREPELLNQFVNFVNKYRKPDVDYIAVVNGPGLEPCLWVGVNFARALSFVFGIPLIPINHIESHILVNFLKHKEKDIKKFLPALSLVVSGGHTQLILVKEIGKYKIIGETRDDAAGECFDKCAKILGLDYPGGPVIAKIALQQKSKAQNPKFKISLPRPMIDSKDYDFSFSGLKTAVLYKVQDTRNRIQETKDKEIDNLSEDYIREMAKEVQDSIIEVLINKTFKAVEKFKVKSLILGGGVSANKELRRQFKLKVESEKLKVNLMFPEPHLSTDNALMSAVTGYFNRKNTKKWQEIKAEANLRVG